MELEEVKLILKDKESAFMGKLRAIQEDITLVKKQLSQLNSKYLRKYEFLKQKKIKTKENIVKDNQIK